MSGRAEPKEAKDTSQSSPPTGGNHMGLLMAFYAGDRGRIAETFALADPEPLWEQPFVAAYADFSLHLTPLDLDLLSEEACRLAGAKSATLSESLEECLGGDGVSNAAQVVSRAWVETMACLAEDQAEELALRWWARAEGEHGGRPSPLTPEALGAVGDLIRLCRTARQENLTVVHTWCL